MLEIALRDGGFDCRKDGDKVTIPVTFPKAKFRLPNDQISFIPRVADFPTLKEMHDYLKADGRVSDAHILSALIEYYLPWYCFNVLNLKRISTVIGLIGHRGSGKTASAVYMMIFDYLIRGLPVFSNVAIAVKVKYLGLERVFRSRPWNGLDMLDMEGDINGGVVFVDEVNLAVAESTRHMAGANLAWANDLQQLRKKQLNVIWTAQSWNTVDNRTRWQTDWVVECQDCFNDHSYKAKYPGDKVKWTVYELSGLSGTFDLTYELDHKNICNYQIGNTTMVWIRPVCWPAYNTFEAQDDDYIKRFKIKEAQSKAEVKTIILEEGKKVARSIAESVAGSDNERVYADDIWGKSEADHSLKTEVGGMLIREFGFKKGRENTGARRTFYERVIDPTPLKR